MDLMSLTRVGCCLLGHPPGEFLTPPVFGSAIRREGRRMVQHLFINPAGQRYRRAFERAHRAAGAAEITWLDTRRILSATLGLTRLYQSIEEGRLVPRSISGFWYHQISGGQAGKFARDAAVYRLRPEAYPAGYLAARTRHFPALGRAILRQILPVLYKSNPHLHQSQAALARAGSWDDLARVVAGCDST